MATRILRNVRGIRFEDGFTLVELTIALVMSGIVLSGIFIIVSGSHSYLLNEQAKINLQQDYSLIDQIVGNKVRESTLRRVTIYATYADYLANQPHQTSGTCIRLFSPGSDSTTFYKDNSDFKVIRSDLTTTNLVAGVVSNLTFTSDTAGVTVALALSQNSQTLSGNLAYMPRNTTKAILILVSDASNPPADDLARQALIESWGYRTSFVDDNSSQNALDAAVDSAAAVYISESTVSTNLGTKLTSATIGIVIEEGALRDEFGIASFGVSPSSTDINISSNSHYIVSPFSTGSLTIRTSASGALIINGTLAPGLQSWATIGGDDALVTLEAGASLYTGGSAAGRRVLLPWGNTGFFTFNTLNDNGQLIMKRALTWAAGDN